MKLKQLEAELQDVSVFQTPKWDLEQYPTTAHLAARIIYTAHNYGDLEDKKVVDLGVGCGILTIGGELN